MYKIQVSEEKCIGCGTCAAICPENFQMTNKSKSEVKKQEVEKLGCNKIAEESCPTQAIRVEPVK